MYLYMTKDGEYIALDDASGGYPYVTDNQMRVKLWKTEDEARGYLSESEQQKGWILKKFKGLMIEDITSG